MHHHRHSRQGNGIQILSVPFAAHRVDAVVPILILVVIAVPSFRLLYYSDKATEATVTIKARGHQWYWSYVYEASYEVDAQGKPVL